MSIDVKVTGLKELASAVSNLGEAIGGKFMQQSLRGAGRLIGDRARELAPVDTGTLRKAIVTGIRRSSEKEHARVAIFIRKLMPPETVRNPNPKPASVYAPGVEFGHDTRGGGHIPPKPFLRPAFDEKKLAVVEEFKVVLRKKIERLGK